MTKNNIAYLCDHKACEVCSYKKKGDCNHTTNIEHAINFKSFDDGIEIKYMEEEKIKK